MARAAVADWQRSVSIYPSSPTDFGSSNFDQTVSHFKSLGFNYVTLVIPQYQSNVGSSDVGPGGNTPIDASLIAGIQYAHAQGMGVILKIHLDTYDGQWRAHIYPNDRTAWFTNYKNMLLKYAAIAKQNSVEEYCLGTELISVASGTVNPDNTTQWLSMIAAVRGAYSGKLLYDANWGSGSFATEPPQIGFWGSLDYIGISAYYNLGGDGSVASLTSDWDSVNTTMVRPLTQQFGKPVLFSELGYRSVVNAHLEPWNSGLPGAYSSQEQVNDYTALLQYWNAYPYLQGIGLWYAVTDPNAGGNGNTDYLIENKPVEQTLQQLFTSMPSSGGGGGSGGNPNFSVSGTAMPTSIQVGQAVALNVSVTDQGGAASGANVDVEVYNAAGSQVFQKVLSGQNFSAGQGQQYSASWTPNVGGAYTLKVGVFNSSWSQVYTWNNGVAAVSVVTASGGGSGGSGTATTDVWWPSNGATVSGVQPFKALVENLPLSQYAMYWQVDGGQLNLMQDSTQDAPHKESMVDLTNWTWRGSGPYTVTFVAKSPSGTTVSQKSVQITVSH